MGNRNRVVRFEKLLELLLKDWLYESPKEGFLGLVDLQDF